MKFKKSKGRQQRQCYRPLKNWLKTAEVLNEPTDQTDELTSCIEDQAKEIKAIEERLDKLEKAPGKSK